MSFMADAIAHDLVMKLDLKSENRYVLVFKRGTIGQDILMRAQSVLHRKWGVETIALVVQDSPQDAIVALEVVPQGEVNDES